MRILLAFITLMLVTLGPCDEAWAHASLIASTPSQHDVLRVAPMEFTLSFNEPVSPLVLALIAPDGSQRPLTDFRLRDSKLQIVPPTGLGNGTFVISYRVISGDGHPVAGSIIFSIGAPITGSAEIETGAIDWPLRVAIWTSRVLLYAGLFFGIGSAFFRDWIAPDAMIRRRETLFLLTVGLAAAPICIGLQGLDALGLSLTSIWRPETWAAGLATSLGTSTVIAFVSMALAIVSGKLAATTARLLSLLAFAGIGLALSTTGHAAAAEPQWLTRPAVFLHATCIAFWAGSLVPLWILLRAGTEQSIAALRRFSRIIPFALLPLIIAGAFLAVIQLGSPGALIATAYGQVFLIKLSLVLAVFAVAAFNRWRLTKPVERGNQQATRALIRIVVFESILIFAIMGVAAAWRFTPPPRSLSQIAATPLSIHLHTDKAMAEITFSSGRAGETSADIFLMSPEFGPLDAQGLALVASNPGAGIQQVKYPAEKQPDGTWQVQHMSIPLPGDWTIGLEIRISDFQMVKIEDGARFER